MNQFAMVNRKGTPGQKFSAKSRTTESAFDRWLNRGLHELFDDVMKEPIPEQFFDILRRTAPPDLGSPEPADTGDAATTPQPPAKTGKSSTPAAAKKPKPDPNP